MGRKSRNLGMAFSLAALVSAAGCTSFEQNRQNNLMRAQASWERKQALRREQDRGPKQYHSYSPGRDLPLLGWVMGANARVNDRLTPKQREALAYTADVIHAHTIADAGRSDIQLNVNVYNDDEAQQTVQRPRNLQRPRPIRLGNAFLACNDWIDFNGDGRTPADFSEYVGIKNDFYTDEKVTFASRIMGSKGQTLTFQFYDSNGLQYERDHTITGDGFVKRFSLRPDQLSPGSYAGEWYVNGNHVGTTQINVTVRKID